MLGLAQLRDRRAAARRRGRGRGRAARCPRGAGPRAARAGRAGGCRARRPRRGSRGPPRPAGSRRPRWRSRRGAAASRRRTGCRASCARRGPRGRGAGGAARARSARPPRSASPSRSARRCPPRSRSWPRARPPRRCANASIAACLAFDGSWPWISSTRCSRNSVERSRSNSAVAALAWSASDSSTSGQTTKHWRPAAISSRMRSYARSRARAPSTTKVSTGRRPAGSSRSAVASRSP